MILTDFIISEGGNLMKTEICDEKGEFICFANDPCIDWSEISADEYKLFAVDNGNWIAVQKRNAKPFKYKD